MARLGRGKPVRGVTILGPGPGYAPPPAGPVASFVSARRDLPPARRDVPKRAVQILGPKIVGAPIVNPDPVGRFVFSRPPLSRVRRLFPQPTINWVDAGPAPCRLNFVLTVRANLNFELEVPNTTMGRAPLDFLIVNCRNEV